MGLFSRKQKATSSRGSEETVTAYQSSRPTGLRIFTVLIYLIAVIFLILVEIGTINNKAVIRDTYFLKINLSNIIPQSVPNAVIINSIARTIGLHDFYQVGLWGFCEGYDGEGITYCSPPKTLYWFNPVEIILSELLAGATIALPTELVDVLHLIRLASRWMFVCFLVGICLSFICIFIAPMGFSKEPRWSHRGRRLFCRQLPITILTFLALLFTAAASVIATVMFLIFRNKLSGAADLNIKAILGIKMLAFEWVATGLLLLGFILQIGTCCGVCCCTGKRKAMKKGQLTESPVHEKDAPAENSGRRFGFKQSAA